MSRRRRWQIRAAALLLVVLLLTLLVAVGALGAPAADPDGTGFAPVLSRAPQNAAFLQFVQVHRTAGEVLAITDGIPRVSGHVPAPLSVGFRGTPGAAEDSLRAAAELPATFDLRSAGRVTPVKNQGSDGTCWAFAAIGSLESGLMPGESWDFSEDNVVNGTRYEWVGYDSGGNSLLALAYLARWGGPVAEASDPYHTPGTLDLPPVRHTQNALRLPPRLNSLDNSALKNAVMTYGAVDVSIYWDNAYYSSGTHSYYYSQERFANHDVLLVGWDDSYSRTNFSAAGGMPPGNGAFIVKNSWGTNWGAAGFFYLSYYDKVVGSEWSTVFAEAEPSTNYGRAYQYDPLGWVSSYGYGGETAWFANRFTGEADEAIQAVGFYASTPGSSYRVYGGATLATLTQLGSGTFSEAGYHTVQLLTPLPVNAAAPFVVAVRLTTPGNGFPIPVEEFVADYANATGGPNQSYISSNGTTWTDMNSSSQGANVCLKAFTPSALTPAVTGLSPSSGARNGGNRVTITGTGFTGLSGTSAVTFGGLDALSYVVESDNSLIAVTPAHTPGPVDVVVTGEGGSSGDTPADDYTYLDRVDINLAAGWNLVAAGPGTAFADTLFAWNGTAYESAVSPVGWKGYWVRTTTPVCVTLVPVAGPHTFTLTEGWNLIGNPMDAEGTLALPIGVQAFVWDAAAMTYRSVTALAPGQGAWVRGAAGDQVVLTAW